MLKPPAKVRKLLTLITAIFLLCLVLVIALYPVLERPGLAPGADTGSYIFTTKFIGDSIRTSHHLPNINPYWYNGFEVLHNTPPLVYLPMVLLYLIFKDILLVSRLGHLLFTLAMGLSMFIIIYKKHSTLSALVGATLFTLTPIIFFQVVGGGSYTRVLALAMFPPAFYFSNKVLETQNQQFRNLAFSAIFLSLALLGHPMVGAMGILFITIYAIFRVILDSEISFLRFFYWLIIGLLALGLTAWYLWPYFAEQTGWTSVPEDLYKLQSLSVRAELSWLSFLAPALALIALFLKRNAALTSLFFAGLISMLFALGAYLPVNLLLPFKSIYPFLALLFSGFAFSLMAAELFDLKSYKSKRYSLKNATAVILIPIVLAISTLIGHNYSIDAVGPRQRNFFEGGDIDVAKALGKFSNTGRVMPMKYPFSLLFWWINTISDKQMVEGWYYSLTPTGKHIARIYDAVDDGYPEYVPPKLDYMNVRYLLTNGNFRGRQYGKLLTYLKKQGFTSVYQKEPYAIYLKNQRSSFLVPVKTKTLVIGKYSAKVAALMPISIEGGSIYIDDYDLNTLKFFDQLVLNGFGYHNEKRATKLIQDYVRSGGRVAVDLMGMEGNALEQNPSFLGVSSVPLNMKGEATFEKVGDSGIANAFNHNSARFAFENGEWRSKAYAGLDKTLLKLKYQGTSYDILGYKQIGAGKIYFVGANLFYRAYLTHSSTETKLIKKLVTLDTNQEISPVSFETESVKPERINFAYSSVRDLPLLVSYAWSPHWKAYVDGKEIKVYNIEDLIFLSLPKGKHFVEVKYGNTPIHYSANSISVLTLLFLGFLVYRERRRTSVKEAA